MPRAERIAASPSPSGASPTQTVGLTRLARLEFHLANIKEENKENIKHKQ